MHANMDRDSQRKQKSLLLGCMIYCNSRVNYNYVCIFQNRSWLRLASFSLYNLNDKASTRELRCVNFEIRDHVLQIDFNLFCWNNTEWTHLGVKFEHSALALDFKE